jgi:hypothetical protein
LALQKGVEILKGMHKNEVTTADMRPCDSYLHDFRDFRKAFEVNSSLIMEIYYTLFPIDFEYYPGCESQIIEEIRKLKAQLDNNP